MNTEYLVEYLELIKRMNFTSTAKYLSITQSALSKHVSALEKEFGATFFTREADGIELTKQGRAFGMQAHRMMDLYAETKAVLSDVSSEVRIGGSISDDAVMRIISEAKLLLREKPGAPSITIDHQAADDPAMRLKSGKIDLFIGVASNESEASGAHTILMADSAFETATFAVIPLVVVMQTTNSLAEHEALSALDLEGRAIVYPICNIAFAAGATTIDEYLTRHGVNARKELTYADTIMDLTQACTGENLLITPRSNISRRLFPATMGEIVTRPLVDEDAVFVYNITWRKNEPIEAVRTVLDTLLAASQAVNPVLG